MNIDTRTIHKFLSDAEISELTKLIVKEDKSNLFQDFDPVDHRHIADTYYFDPYSDEFKRAREILIPKIHAEFGSNVHIDSCHILHSYNPYGVHSDVLSGGKDGGAALRGVPSWTFIIPLDDFNSNTIIFNEESPDIKSVEEWVKTHKIKPNPEPISNELYEKYFTHCSKFFMRFLTIEDIFPWSKGALFAASRKKFHVSDNYRAHGLECKKAFIIWTSLVD